MLDSQIVNQLEQVFKALEHRVVVSVYASDHPKQNELLEMLRQIAALSTFIELNLLEESQLNPFFSVAGDATPGIVHFLGIPGGHEFTSLVIAILNADRKGKMPDEQINKRILRLKGAIDLRTYISLSCDNCPEVVQSLNQIALLNPQVKHTMVDGEFVQDEIKALNILGVPSVVSQSELISSGKQNFLQLLEKLEEACGVDADLSEGFEEHSVTEYDVVVIGAGPAGASAAIYASRKGLKTAIVSETFGGQLQETKAIENLISVPLTEGPQLAANLISHMREYNIDFLEHRRVERIEGDILRQICFSGGEQVLAKSVIVATGAKWRELNVPGERDYVGLGVAYCPHCDGPYYKGKRVAVVGGGNSGVEAAIDLAGIVKHVTLLEYGSELKADQVLVEKLRSLSNVEIITSANTTEIVGDGQKVVGLQYVHQKTKIQTQLPLEGVFIQIGLLPNSGFLEGKLATNAAGEIKIDPKCRTSLQGVYAAGDVTDVPYKQIIVSMGEGAKAALTAFEDLMIA